MDAPASHSRSRFLFPSAPAKNEWMDLLYALMDPQQEIKYELATVERLCAQATIVLDAEQAATTVDIPPGRGQAVIVGDIHGQFEDFRTHVLPHFTTDKAVDEDAAAPSEPECKSESTPNGAEGLIAFPTDDTPKCSRVLFLGDYVDRGPQSVEVILFLFALKVEFPKDVFILRGNHEDAQTSRIYGFMAESHAKFAEGGQAWSTFNHVFCHIPLAAVVQSESGKKIFCVHGGLSPGLNGAAAVNRIDRNDYGGMLDNEATSLVDGMLWSDPTDGTARFRPNERGCGFLFGPLATAEFCNDNDFEFLCRAHQMTLEGYSWTHDGRCLTVFSAPNYCGVAGNKGAILLLDSDFNVSFEQYDAVTTEQPAPDVTAGGPMSYFN